MGGNILKIKGIETKRVSTEEIYEIFNNVKKYFKGYTLFMTKFFHNKEDHGDLDFLIKTKNKNEIINIIKNDIPSKGYSVNDRTISFEYKDFQVDAICIEPDIWNISKVFYSYDPIGNLLGKISKGFGLRNGIDGLYYLSVGKGSTKKVNLSRDPYTIFNFLGYDFNRFLKGFDTKKEIFDFIINGKYFDKDLFLYKNLTNKDRKRTMKRKSYNEFLSYIKNKESNYHFKEKNFYIDHINKHFPGFKEIVLNHKKEDEEKININKKFRTIIKDYKNSSILGNIIKYYKLSKNNFKEFISENDIEFLSEDFKDFYKRYKTLESMLYKEFGFGKQVGNDIYIHKKYENYLPKNILNNAKEKLSDDFEYTIIKWNNKNNSLSFIECKDFDYSNEPIVGDSIKIYNDSINYRKKPKRDQIYHHKWMFVKKNYNDFDYEESKLRSLKWYKKYKYNSMMIGYKDYWDKLGINENYTQDEIKIANKTSRTNKSGTGAVGGNPIVPKFVREYSKKTDLILDFGSGKYPSHAIKLKNDGYNVKSHEFGNNFDPDLHDNDAFDHKYDIIYASNVLNVQSSINMLNNTLKDINDLLKNGGIFIANYPKEPRKMNLNVSELKTVINNYFSIKNLGKNTFLMSKQINENLDWIFDEEETKEEEYPIDIEFNKYDNNEIPTYYVESDGIPDRLINHGSVIFNPKKPIQIVDKYEDYNIVRYTDNRGNEVQLGFLDKDLIRIDKNTNENNSYKLVIRNHDIFNINSYDEFIYSTNNFNQHTKKIDNNNSYIKPYEKKGPY